MSHAEYRTTAPAARRVGAAATLAAVLFLAGCNSLALFYNRAPTLAYWQLDSYLDVEKAQKPALQSAIKDWFAWHRAEELPRYVALLSSLRTDVTGPASAARICAINDELRAAFRRALAQALPSLPTLAVTLTGRQRAHLARRYARANAELRETFLDGTPAERRERTTGRALDAARDFYGRLDDAQERLITDGIAASPYDPSIWIAEREARQHDTLEILERIAAIRPERRGEVAKKAFAEFAASLATSPRRPYRDYLARLTGYNCDLIARVHATTTPEQRAHAARELQGWEEDLRAIARRGDE